MEALTPVLLQAAANLDSGTPKEPDTMDTPTLFIHWTHHPNGLQRKDVHHIYDKLLKDALPFKKMQLAVSRPKNL
jgi:hypothetical protein